MLVLPVEFIVRVLKNTKGHKQYEIIYAQANHRAYLVFISEYSISHISTEHISETSIAFTLDKQAVDFFKDFKLKQIATTTYTISESGEVYANTTSLEFVLSVVDFAWEDLQHSYDIVDLVELPSIDVAVMQGLLAYLPAKCLDFYKFNSLGVHTMYGNSLYGLDDDLLRMVIIDLPDLGITPNLDMLYLGDLSNLLYKAKLAYLNLFNEVYTYYGVGHFGKTIQFELVSTYKPQQATIAVPLETIYLFDSKATPVSLDATTITAELAKLKSLVPTDLVPLPERFNQVDISIQIKDLVYLLTNIMDIRLAYYYNRWVGFDAPGISVYITLYKTIYGTHIAS
jgi:hypothetical protein